MKRLLYVFFITVLFCLSLPANAGWDGYNPPGPYNIALGEELQLFVPEWLGDYDEYKWECSTSASILYLTFSDGPWNHVTCKQAFDDEKTVTVRYKNKSDYFWGGPIIYSFKFKTSVTKINLNAESATMSVGENIILVPTVLPENATNKSVTWSSTNKTVASVEPWGDYGQVFANYPGTAYITCKANDGSGVKATCKIIVSDPKPIEVTGIEVTPSSQTIRVGNSFTPTWKPIPSNATTTVTWKSLHPNVATVNESTGEVTGVSKGTATIRATSANGKTGDCTVTVEELPKGPVKMVASSGYHTLVLKEDGTLWTCGHNGTGQLGNVTIGNHLEFVKIADGVRSISAGSEHSFFIKNDGSLWICGRKYWEAEEYSSWGKPKEFTLVPQKITDNVASVSSYKHTLIVKTDGTLWGYGENFKGQLGLGKINETGSVKNPEMIMDNVVSAVAGNHYSVVLKKDGTVWTCGINNFGQLGDGTTTDNYTFTKVKNLINVSSLASNMLQTSFVVKQDGTLWGWGHNRVGQMCDGSTKNVTIPQMVSSNVLSASSGCNLFVVKKDGSLWGGTNNQYGQLGNGTTTDSEGLIKMMDNVASVCNAMWSVFIIKKDGSLWACGNNEYGQLGDGTTINRLNPVKIMEGGDSSNYLEDGDTFTAMTDEGIEMTFQVINAKNKTCQVGKDADTTDATDPDIYLAINKNYQGKVTIPPYANGYEVIGIGSYVMFACELSELEIPNTVTEIKHQAISCCDNLTKVTIPGSVKSFGSGVFWLSSNLKTVVSDIKEPYDISKSKPFERISPNAILYVPKGTKAKYEAAKGWKDCFARIVEGDPTAIESIQAGAKADNAVYSLSGQRLDAPRKGINIINGKKVVIK